MMVLRARLIRDQQVWGKLMGEWDRRFRETHDYAMNHAYAMGFPNFHEADYGRGIVRGHASASSLRVLRDALLENLSDEAERTAEQRSRALMADLLEFHRRDDKPKWWRYFHLSRDLSDEELFDGSDAVAGLAFEGVGEQVKKVQALQVQIPPHKSMGLGTATQPKTLVPEICGRSTRSTTRPACLVSFAAHRNWMLLIQAR